MIVASKKGTFLGMNLKYPRDLEASNRNFLDSRVSPFKCPFDDH
jgi:hypothetical protein